METCDRLDSQEGLLAFNVDSSWINRRTVASIVRTIPGVRIIRAGGWWRDIFCMFELAGVRFQVCEDWAANYCVGPETLVYSPETERVRAAFVAHVASRRRNPMGVGIALAIGGLVLAVVAYKTGSPMEAVMATVISVAGAVIVRARVRERGAALAPHAAKIDRGMEKCRRATSCGRGRRKRRNLAAGLRCSTDGGT